MYTQFTCNLCCDTHPTIVPIPTSLSTLTAANEVKSSGAEEPAAMNVAPATSSDKSNFSEIASREGTKKSSQMRASPEQEKQVMHNKKSTTVMEICFVMLVYGHIRVHELHVHVHV